MKRKEGARGLYILCRLIYVISHFSTQSPALPTPPDTVSQPAFFKMAAAAISILHEGPALCLGSFFFFLTVDALSEASILGKMSLASCGWPF